MSEWHKRTNNPEIRERMAREGITFQQIADYIGIQHQTIINWTKDELTPERFDRIWNAMDEIENGEKASKPKRKQRTERQLAGDGVRRIRQLMKENDLRQWEVAVKLGVHPSTFCTMLRYEPTPYKREQIEAAIQAAAEEKRRYQK